MYFLGLDIGTTGCKSMLLDENFNIVSQDYIEYDLIYSDCGMVEQSPLELWEMTKHTIMATVSSSKVSVKKIKAMGISAQGISFVPIDRCGKEIGNIISWLDTRAQVQTDKVRKLLGEDYIFKTTGKRIKASYTLPKIMWLKENMPDVYQNTFKFLMVLEYITNKLTGHILTDYSMASGTMMFNVSKCQWDEKILNACGIEREKLPDVDEMGARLGKILSSVASELGLDSEMEVILGAQDQKCAAVGAGIRQNVATVALGTATAISILSYNPKLKGMQNIPCFALGEKSWTYEAVIGTSGAAFKWMRNLFDMGYDDMCSLAEQSPAGSNGMFFYPHFAGAGSPYWNAQAKGSFYGITLTTDKADMIRSLLEGIAFQIKANIDVMEETTETEIKEVRLFGGGSKQELWVQIIADITGLPVNVLYTSEVANVGAAIFAANGIGFGAEIKEAKLIKCRYLPRQKIKEEYRKLIKDYLDIQSRIIS